MRDVLIALLFAFSMVTSAFTKEITEIDDTSLITYCAPYSLRVNGSAIEIKFAENKDSVSMILSDQTGNVLFSNDTVVLDNMNSVSIPLTDTGMPMTLDIRCTAFTGRSYIPATAK